MLRIALAEEYPEYGPGTRFDAVVGWGLRAGYDVLDEEDLKKAEEFFRIFSVFPVGEEDGFCLPDSNCCCFSHAPRARYGILLARGGEELVFIGEKVWSDGYDLDEEERSKFFLVVGSPDPGVPVLEVFQRARRHAVAWLRSVEELPEEIAQNLRCLS